MISLRPTKRFVFPLLFVASIAFAQAPTIAPTPPPAPPAAATSVTPATPAAPAPPPSPVSGIRSKLAANDLLSAESILEMHGVRNGQDGPYLLGLSWLARGALLTGDVAKARTYAADVFARCADSLAHGTKLADSHDIEIALGAAIEVEAQLIERDKGAKAAAAYMRDAIARYPGPTPFASRLHKRLNMLSLIGTPAPEIVAEDFVGAAPPSLASLRGKPVAIFIWSESCGDCKAQASTLAKLKQRHASSDLQWISLTRYFEDEAKEYPAEKARVDSVWKAVYKDVGTVPIPMSTASMVTYGGSSTPTFVFIDRRGVVRGYTPTRLTEAEFEKQLAVVLK